MRKLSVRDGHEAASFGPAKLPLLPERSSTRVHYTCLLPVCEFFFFSPPNNRDAMRRAKEKEEEKKNFPLVFFRFVLFSPRSVRNTIQAHGIFVRTYVIYLRSCGALWRSLVRRPNVEFTTLRMKRFYYITLGLRIICSYIRSVYSV